jgi:uncharacterized protein YndB with AHSA1/START domain
LLSESKGPDRPWGKTRTNIVTTEIQMETQRSTVMTAAQTSKDQTSKDPASKDQTSRDFVISRVLDAPRELVWKAFTEPERMKQWWGPKGFSVIASKMDFRPGGTYLYGLKSPNGAAMWGKFVYREIVPNERMVLINSFSDEAGGVTRHPMAPTWPLELLSTFTFEDEPGGKTKLTIRWSAHNATEEERNAFDTSHDSMRQGWGGTLEQLTEYLASARS